MLGCARACGPPLAAPSRAVRRALPVPVAGGHARRPRVARPRPRQPTPAACATTRLAMRMNAWIAARNVRGSAARVALADGAGCCNGPMAVVPAHRRAIVRHGHARVPPRRWPAKPGAGFVRWSRSAIGARVRSLGSRRCRGGSWAHARRGRGGRAAGNRDGTAQRLCAPHRLAARSAGRVPECKGTVRLCNAAGAVSRAPSRISRTRPPLVSSWVTVCAWSAPRRCLHRVTSRPRTRSWMSRLSARAFSASRSRMARPPIPATVSCTGSAEGRW